MLITICFCEVLLKIHSTQHQEKDRLQQLKHTKSILCLSLQVDYSKRANDPTVVECAWFNEGVIPITSRGFEFLIKFTDISS